MNLLSKPLLATILSQVLGLLLSMYFTLDVWWLKVTREIKYPVKMSQRFIFLGIGAISATLASYFVGLISIFRFLTTTQVLVVNWLVLAAIAIIKYAFFKFSVFRIQD